MTEHDTDDPAALPLLRSLLPPSYAAEIIFSAAMQIPELRPGVATGTRATRIFAREGGGAARDRVLARRRGPSRRGRRDGTERCRITSFP
jgi:hypothetical protein